MPKFKLTYEQALEARELYKQHVPQREIASRFGVARGAISELVRGKTWGLKNISRGKARGEDNSAKLTKRDVRRIRKLCAEGAFQYAVAEEYGVSQSLINAIVRRRKWVHIKDPKGPSSK